MKNKFNDLQCLLPVDMGAEYCSANIDRKESNTGTKICIYDDYNFKYKLSKKEKSKILNQIKDDFGIDYIKQNSTILFFRENFFSKPTMYNISCENMWKHPPLQRVYSILRCTYGIAFGKSNTDKLCHIIHYSHTKGYENIFIFNIFVNNVIPFDIINLINRNYVDILLSYLQ
jgi:hypothetical protein